MMQGMTDRAIKTEAITALGAIREAMREYYTQYQDWPDQYSGADMILTQYFSAAALTGAYFSANCYVIGCVDNGALGDALGEADATKTKLILAHFNNMAIECIPSQSTAPKADSRVLGFNNIYMLLDGSTFESNLNVFNS
jgi:type II secretory pathway pseudopilin PulG